MRDYTNKHSRQTSRLLNFLQHHNSQIRTNLQVMGEFINYELPETKRQIQGTKLNKPGKCLKGDQSS